MKILVTGAAGFIGFHTSKKLLANGEHVVGVDNVNDYYSVDLKQARLNQLQTEKNFSFRKLDISDKAAMSELFRLEKFDRVINLAAQAGVRYSIENPYTYIDSNVTGFLNILEGCRHNNVEHLVYASTSSVYGASEAMPFRETETASHPLAIYAATKRTNELMAHSYSHLFGLPTTGLRFFTVYGPWGRPDMALFLFARKILAGEPIQVFNYGNHKRDFTYVADIVEGITRSMYDVAKPNPDWDPKSPDVGTSKSPYRIFNIGNNSPVDLSYYITVLENCLGRKAEKEFLPLQPGDVPETFADSGRLERAVDYRPSTTVEEGVSKFVDWYISFYSNKGAKINSN